MELAIPRANDGSIAVTYAPRAPKAATIACRTPRLSDCNRLHGFIEEVRVDGLLAQVRLRVGDQSLTAVITADAVRALKLRRGDDAMAIVKSTEVMIAKASEAQSRPRRREKVQS